MPWQRLISKGRALRTAAASQGGGSALQGLPRTAPLHSRLHHALWLSSKGTPHRPSPSAGLVGRPGTWGLPRRPWACGKRENRRAGPPGDFGVVTLNHRGGAGGALCRSPQRNPVPKPPALLKLAGKPWKRVLFGAGGAPLTEPARRCRREGVRASGRCVAREGRGFDAWDHGAAAHAQGAAGASADAAAPGRQGRPPARAEEQQPGSDG